MWECGEISPRKSRLKPVTLRANVGVFALSYSNFKVLPTNSFKEPLFKVLKKSPGFCCYSMAWGQQRFQNQELIVVKVNFIFGKMKMNFFFQSFVNIEDNGTNRAVVNDINEFEYKILFV
jgi:hypothetical protein